MDYEKAYKEALGRANAKIETYNHLGNVSVAKSIEEIFPELAESEDEKTRKEIILWMKGKNGTADTFQKNKERWIAWLEKQKPVEWSNADLAYVNSICDLIKDSRYDETSKTDFISWLKSLKPRHHRNPTAEQLTEGLDAAAKEWDRKASFSPVAMTLDSQGNPNGIEQFITSHADSFKAGADWILEKLKTL